MKYHALFEIFEKVAKFDLSSQIIGDALSVKIQLFCMLDIFMLSCRPLTFQNLLIK